MAWVSILDDTYWKDDGSSLTLVWDGPNDWWDVSAGSNGARLSALIYGSGWQTDYRPTHVRITYQNSAAFDLDIRDGHGDFIIDEALYVSGTEVAMNHDPTGDVGNDIWRINFGALGAYPDATIEITDIEFLEDDPTTTTTTTTTTTAPPFEASASQGGGADAGIINEGFGGFGFGWG